MAVSEYVPSAQRDYEFEGQKGRSGARGARQEDDRKPKRKQGGDAKTANEVKAHRRPARGGLALVLSRCSGAWEAWVELGPCTLQGGR